jgi:hypothetical protein
MFSLQFRHVARPGPQNSNSSRPLRWGESVYVQDSVVGLQRSNEVDPIEAIADFGATELIR